MQHLGINPSQYGLENHGIGNVNQIFWNLNPPTLLEHAILRREGILSNTGALVVRTGQRTGRSPKDKYIIEEPSSRHRLWWGEVNVPFSEESFDMLFGRILAYLQGMDLYVQDCYAGADPEYRIPIRAITEYACHSLFVRQVFVRPDTEALANHIPRFTVLSLPQFHADPDFDGTHSEAFVAVHFGRGLVVIVGTMYAGEIKKSVFTVLNYLLPLERVLSMHCSANVGQDGDAALFFGLSGTGKTTLSADPTRRLIGDDQHGWSDKGVFNFEGGCYAKCIRLSKEYEPQIWNAMRFGAMLENVTLDPDTREMDFDDDTFTENTRAGFPVSFVDGAIIPGVTGHPKNVVLLTCDAFGVMPPMSKLTPQQAMYHFMSGYTAKVAGTEAGINEPQATFSTCFGAPFLPLHPSVYAKLLGEKIATHKAQCWLFNTGWTGGPYGVGQRMNIHHTRSMLRAALNGDLDDVPYRADPLFGLQVPQTCPGVPAEVLNPRDTWDDKQAYDVKARDLASRFVENFRQFTDAPPEIRAAGPSV